MYEPLKCAHSYIVLACGILMWNNAVLIFKSVDEIF